MNHEDLTLCYQRIYPFLTSLCSQFWVNMTSVNVYVYLRSMKLQENCISDIFNGIKTYIKQCVFFYHQTYLIQYVDYVVISLTTRYIYIFMHFHSSIQKSSFVESFWIQDCCNIIYIFEASNIFKFFFPYKFQILACGILTRSTLCYKISYSIDIFPPLALCVWRFVDGHKNGHNSCNKTFS